MNRHMRDASRHNIVCRLSSISAEIRNAFMQNRKTNSSSSFRWKSSRPPAVLAVYLSSSIISSLALIIIFIYLYIYIYSYYTSDRYCSWARPAFKSYHPELAPIRLSCLIYVYLKSLWRNYSHASRGFLFALACLFDWRNTFYRILKNKTL